MTTNQTVSAKVRVMMALRGWTQADVGRAIGTSQVNVSRKLRGRAQWHADDIGTLAAAWGVSAGWLVNDDDLPGGQLPRLDSNQQPAGYMDAALLLAVA